MRTHQTTNNRMYQSLKPTNKQQLGQDVWQDIHKTKRKFKQMERNMRKSEDVNNGYEINNKEKAKKEYDKIEEGKKQFIRSIPFIPIDVDERSTLQIENIITQRYQPGHNAIDTQLQTQRLRYSKKCHEGQDKFNELQMIYRVLIQHKREDLAEIFLNFVKLIFQTEEQQESINIEEVIHGIQAKIDHYFHENRKYYANQILQRKYEQYEHKFNDIMVAVYKLKATIEQLEQEQSISSIQSSSNESSGSNGNKEQAILMSPFHSPTTTKPTNLNKCLQGSIQRCKRQLSQLLSAITSRNNNNYQTNEKYISENIINCMTSEEARNSKQLKSQSNKQESKSKMRDKQVPHRVGNNGSDKVEKSVKPFSLHIYNQNNQTIQTNQYKQHPNQDIRQLAQLSKYTQIIDGMYVKFKYTYKFMFELLYTSLYSSSWGNKPNNLLKQCQQSVNSMYSNYTNITLPLQDSSTNILYSHLISKSNDKHCICKGGNSFHRLSQLHQFISKSTAQLEEIRIKWKNLHHSSQSHNGRGDENKENINNKNCGAKQKTKLKSINA